MDSCHHIPPIEWIPVIIFHLSPWFLSCLAFVTSSFHHGFLNFHRFLSSHSTCLTLSIAYLCHWIHFTSFCHILTPSLISLTQSYVLHWFISSCFMDWLWSWSSSCFNRFTVVVVITDLVPTHQKSLWLSHVSAVYTDSLCWFVAITDLVPTHQKSLWLSHVSAVYVLICSNYRFSSHPPEKPVIITCICCLYTDSLCWCYFYEAFTGALLVWCSSCFALRVFCQFMWLSRLSCFMLTPHVYHKCKCKRTWSET